jgi:hypothetical protein
MLYALGKNNTMEREEGKPTWMSYLHMTMWTVGVDARLHL